jgi:hypothetical protein
MKHYSHNHLLSYKKLIRNLRIEVQKNNKKDDKNNGKFNNKEINSN